MRHSSILTVATTGRTRRPTGACGSESAIAALKTLVCTRFGVRPQRTNSAGKRGFMKWLSLLLFLPTLGAQTIFNCSSGFSPSTGPCAVDLTGYNPDRLPFSVPTSSGANSSFSGSKLILLPYPGGHFAQSLMYQAAPVNVQAFTANFVFIPDGKNVAFALSDTSNEPNGFPYGAANFQQGAGCEAGFYQAFPGTSNEPNNVFALEIDQGSALTNVSPYTFTYSSVQIYQGNNTGGQYGAQSPCIPPYNTEPGQNDPAPTKISTYPVPLNSPASKALTTTGDTYSATIIYNGSSVTLNLYDITAGGSCPGATCFSYTWTGVNIPSTYLGGNNTAYVGITAGSNSDNVAPLYINSFTYTQGLAPAAPALVSVSVR